MFVMKHITTYFSGYSFLCYLDGVGVTRRQVSGGVRIMRKFMICIDHEIVFFVLYKW